MLNICVRKNKAGAAVARLGAAVFYEKGEVHIYFLVVISSAVRMFAYHNSSPPVISRLLIHAVESASSATIYQVLTLHKP